MTEKAAKLKMSMEAGSILFDGLNEIDDEFVESSATHADTSKGLTAEKWSKVW